MTVVIRPPSWGRIHFVDDVPVRLYKDWHKSIKEARLKIGHFTVHEIGDLCPPIGIDRSLVNFVLVNLIAGGSCRQALDWAKRSHLLPASPRHVFALAKHRPILHRKLGTDHIYIVSPIKYNFGNRAFVVSVHLPDRRVSWSVTDWFEEPDYAAYTWIAFLRM
jgi:hypothetical protein